MEWAELVADLRNGLGREPTLDELVKLAADYEMSEAEIQAQRANYVRGEMALGLDRDEALWRERNRP